MSQTKIQIAQPFQFLFQKARYKAAYGGRGSGKSTAFAQAAIIKGVQEPLRILCCREIQKSIKDSVKRLIDDLITQYKLQDFFVSTETEIRGKNGTLFLFAGLKTNPEAIKSMEGLDIAWVEEADRLSQKSLDLLIPTVRKPESEIWFSWNPDSELDAVDLMFRGQVVPPDAMVKEVNFSDNIFFPDVLKVEADHCKTNYPEKYNHIWLGGYNLVKEGTYYAKQIAEAIEQNRITRVTHDLNVPVQVAWDLGYTDNTSIWFYQYVGQQIHFIDFFEASGQEISWYARELKQKPYNYAPLVLPHDAYHKNIGTGKTIAEILQNLGFSLRYSTLDEVPKLPIVHGIEAARALFNKCWFDSEACKQGLKHLQNYREKINENLKVSMGPLHDEHSHAADAFRYFAVAHQNPVKGHAAPVITYNEFGQPIIS